MMKKRHQLLCLCMIIFQTYVRAQSIPELIQDKIETIMDSVESDQHGIKSIDLKKPTECALTIHYKDKNNYKLYYSSGDVNQTNYHFNQDKLKSIVHVYNKGEQGLKFVFHPNKVLFIYGTMICLTRDTTVADTVFAYDQVEKKEYRIITIAEYHSVKDGVWFYFDETSKLIRKEIWEKGVLIQSKNYKRKANQIIQNIENAMLLSSF